jgi:hypothetical protein
VIIRKFVHDELKCLRFQITFYAYFLRGIDSVGKREGKGSETRSAQAENEFG